MKHQKASMKGENQEQFQIILIMDTYNWTKFGFIGTAVEFGRRFGKYKAVTYVNACKRVSRARYNSKGYAEQAVYEMKRSRARLAYCIYVDDDLSESYLITKKEYEALDLPVADKSFSPVFLTFKDIVLPMNFKGNCRDENRVPSAMEAYRKAAERFALQVMLATGYFNTMDKLEVPEVRINHTSVYITYSNGIEFLFDSSVDADGVNNCRLTTIRQGDDILYNSFRYFWTGTVGGVESHCRQNPDCESADLYYG